jgi:glycosyltransferase involved in cell wall biosynthesis
MKFCVITTFFPPEHFGGDAIFVANLASALADAGHEVQVVHCADSFELLRKRVSPLPFPIDRRVKVHTLRSPAGPLSPALTHLTGRPALKSQELRRILSQDFDVTHWHNLSLVGGPAALPLGRGIQLCTLHDYWWICPTSILFKYNREVCLKRNCLTCSLVHYRPPQVWRRGSLLRDGVRCIDRFLAPSEFVQKKYAESSLAIQATVLPHFVPDTPLVTAGTREDYYLFVGRLERAKGLQTVIPLFGETRRRLLVVGTGNYERELHRQAAGYPVIEFLGPLPHGDLPRLYAKARATLLPSLCYETFGLTVLESLQQQTPAIVHHLGAPPEIIAKTRGGVVYRDIKELRQLLDAWDAQPEIPLRLGLEGFSRLAEYSVRAHLDQYFSTIEEATQNSGTAVTRES